MSKTAQTAQNVRKNGELDRRVDRTRKALRDALHELIARKPYDEIRLTEVLTDANVGRSTFYLHFRDKDDLLASTIVDVMSVAGAAPIRTAKVADRVLWFSLPMFEYHAHRRRGANHRMGDRAKTILHGHLERAICDAIDGHVRREFRDGELLKRFIASSFILVLNWWLDGKAKLSPADVDVAFRKLVTPALVAHR